MDKRLKILLVVTLSEMGGAQKVVFNIVAGLPPGLFDVTVACAPGGELVRWLKELSGGLLFSESSPCVKPVHRMEEPPKAGIPAVKTAARQGRPVRVVEIPELKREISPVHDFLSFWRLYRLIRREHFDVVHCHSTKAGILGRLAAWLAGAPRVIFTAHGWGINEYQERLFRAFTLLAERLAGAVSTRVVCVSRYDYGKALELKLARPEKLTVIYNGVTEAKDKLSGRNTCWKGRLRAELGLDGSDLLVGTVMRLAPPKEPLFFLEVARRLLNNGSGLPAAPALFFVVIGDGPLRGECEAFVRESGLAGRVFFTGAREDAAELVENLDVFALFSRWEGLPLTVIEAMHAGVPVVANAVGGVGELVGEGETGFLIEGLDAEAAARACGRLLGDGALRRALGEAGRMRARRLLSLGEMLRGYRELYLELCGKK